MMGSCPECGVRVEGSDGPSMTAAVLAHRCDPDEWAEAEVLRALVPGTVVDPRRSLDAELRRTRRMLIGAELVVIVQGALTIGYAIAKATGW